MKRLLVALLAVALAAVLLAGCGGGDGGGEEGSQEGLSKAPYLARLNTDIASFAITLQNMKVAATNAISGNVDQAAFDSAAATVAELRAKYQSMTPPEALKSLHEKWVATLQKAEVAATDLKNKHYAEASQKLDEVKNRFDLIRGEVEAP